MTSALRATPCPSTPVPGPTHRVASPPKLRAHSAAATVEFRFLRNCSLTLTGAVYDRNGSYTYYLRNADGSLMLDPDGKMMTEVRDFKPYFLLDGRLSWEKKGWKLYFDVMNMTDTRYFDFGGLEMPGVWFSGGIVVTIG